MVDNAEVALDLGLLRLPGATPARARRARGDACASRALVFVSGSQGEPLSALSMISVGEHRDVAVGPGDTVVLSARAIPGNERGVSRLISNLFRRGCDVVHPGTARVHVSGHGSRDDLVELLRLTRPRYLVPVHGEYRMLAQHARLAVAGRAPRGPRAARRGRRRARRRPRAARAARPACAAGRVLLDRGGASEVEDVVVRDRRHLSSEGIVVPIVVVDRQTGHARVAARDRDARHRRRATRRAELAEEAGRLLAGRDRRRARPRSGSTPSSPASACADELRRFYKRRTQRRPMVIPVVMEV